MASCEASLNNAASNPDHDAEQSMIVESMPDEVPNPVLMQSCEDGSGNANPSINQNAAASCRVVSPVGLGSDQVASSALSQDGIAAVSCAPPRMNHGDGGATSSPTASTVSSAMNDKPAYHLLSCVMTEEQFEILRRQISVYATICSQLVEMHKALMAQQALLPSMMMSGQQPLFDSVLGSRASGRQRWTPSQIQLQILENLFEKSNGTPSKQKIKAITAELGQHGSISETNVYNWFQNRKARAKRKQQHKDGESEVEPEEMDLRKDKRAAVEMLQENNGFGRDQRDFCTIVVFIDGKPWEVPSTTLDLRGSFGDGVALLDSQRQIVHTDENGFTTCPLHASENYTLIRLV